jgi:hypothetical protein
VSDYIAALKAMGSSNPEGIDDSTLETLLEGEVPEEVRWCDGSTLQTVTTVSCNVWHCPTNCWGSSREMFGSECTCSCWPCEFGTTWLGGWVT